jgi:hypothetical protein
MKTLSIIALILLLGYSSIAQKNPEPVISGRTIEVAAYASQEVLPNTISVSFVLTEYYDNGKLVTIPQSTENIKSLISKMKCDVSQLTIGNIYGYINTNSNGEEFFDHKTKYMMKFKNTDCVHQFLHNVDKRSLQSFNIDGMYYDKTDSILRLVQIKAFNKAKDKANVYLKLFGEERGKLLEIQELNRFETLPDFSGKGGSVNSVNIRSGISSIESDASKSMYLKIEYLARVVFEIK